jgi:hypothetical protein
MKRSLLLFTLILVAYSLSGQQNFTAKSATAILKQTPDRTASALAATIRLNNMLSENYNAVSSLWENSSKTEFTYGTNSDVSTSSAWNLTTSLWELSSKTEHTYDVSGNLTVTLTYSYNKATSQWISSAKIESTYDANGNETQYTYSMWNPGTSQFDPLSKVEYTYDAGNNITSEISSSYNSGTSTWTKTSKTEYLYTAGKNTQDLTYTWDLAHLPTPDWAISQKTDYLYNGSGKLTTETTYDWDATLLPPAFVEKDKTEIGYDGSGNMNLITSYTWDTDWVPQMKSEYLFDINKNITQYTLSMWNGIAWVGYSKSESVYTTNKTVTTASAWNTGSSTWDLKTRTTYNFSDVTAIEKHTNNGIKIYPNPASDFIIIESDGGSGTATVQIFDLQGRKVLDQKQSGERQVIPSSDMKTGVYLYRINVNGKVTSGKLFIE